MKFKILWILIYLYFQTPLHAQPAKIFYGDNNEIELSRVTLLRSEMFFYKKFYKTNSPEKSDQMTIYPLNEIKTVSFKYEKGNSTDLFYYLFIIEGVTKEGKAYSKKVKAWDWLEISIPESSTGRHTDLLFFTEKKNPVIRKIIFEN